MKINVRSICSIDHYQFENKFYNHQIQVYSQALDCHRKAFSIRSKHLPADHFRFGTTYDNMGEVYHDLGEYDNALKYYEMDLEVYTKSLPTQHIDTFRPFKCIASLHPRSSYREALRLCSVTIFLCWTNGFIYTIECSI